MILIDNTISKKPQFNLALEEALLRQKGDENDYLLIYFNEPSVIIGRHQNIYEEVNLTYCYENSIPIFRRISGGGAVYHDLGNLNFSFIGKKSTDLFNNYHPFLKPITKALNKIGVMAQINDRNDIVLNEKKISGSAQFTAKSRMITHGTLLYNADLTTAQKVLNASMAPFYNSKSKKSQRSSITNISDYLCDSGSMSNFKDTLIDFLESDGMINRGESIRGELLQNAEELLNERYGSWTWNYGRSPVSSFKRSVIFPQGNVAISCKIRNGIFENFLIQSSFIVSKQISVIENLFNGQRNDIITIKSIVREINKLNVERIDWVELFTGK